MAVKKILVVEDETTSRKILGLALEAADRELIYAEDGESAIELAKHHRPDLIIMDIMLPRLNGFEAARKIKADDDLKDTPILALTARTTLYDEEQAREAGCSDFMTKPFRIGGLRERIERLLGPGQGKED